MAYSCLFILIALFFTNVANAQIILPSQFVAKQYSELLGRIPDSGGWRSNLNSFSSSGCNSSTLKSVTKEIANSTEFISLNYTNSQKIFALYRSIQNRDPDSGGHNFWTNDLDRGIPINNIIDAFYQNLEIPISSICQRAPYGFRYTRPQDLLSNNNFYTKTTLASSDLEGLAPGTVHNLSPNTVYVLSDTLVIPKGITLRTSGFNYSTNNHLYNQLQRQSYTKMAKIVMDVSKCGIEQRATHKAMVCPRMIKMKPGSHLQFVWVEGPGRVQSDGVDRTVRTKEKEPDGSIAPRGMVLAASGSSGSDLTTIEYSRFSISYSEATLVMHDSDQSSGKCNGIIRGNLVTGYSQQLMLNYDIINTNDRNYEGNWADAIQMACDAGLVEKNEIIDSTDFGIIVFPHSNDVNKPLETIVRDNYILNAGNTAAGALGVEPLEKNFNVGEIHYGEVKFDHNEIWTGEYASYIQALAIGSKAWWGNSVRIAIGMTDNGVQFVNNYTPGTERIRADSGITIAGAQDVRLGGNRMNFDILDFVACPTPTLPRIGVYDDDYTANMSFGFGTAIAQSYFEPKDVWGACIYPWKPDRSGTTHYNNPQYFAADQYYLVNPTFSVYYHD